MPGGSIGRRQPPVMRGGLRSGNQEPGAGEGMENYLGEDTLAEDFRGNDVDVAVLGVLVFVAGRPREDQGCIEAGCMGMGRPVMSAVVMPGGQAVLMCADDVEQRKDDAAGPDDRGAAHAGHDVTQPDVAVKSVART